MIFTFSISPSGKLILGLLENRYNESSNRVFSNNSKLADDAFATTSISW